MASNRMTCARLPGVQGSGWADYGRLPPDAIIKQARLHAAYMKSIADAVLSAPDDAFLVETYVGSHVRKDLEIIQPGRRPSEDPTHD